MKKIFSLTPERSRFSPWMAALLGLVAIKAALSVSASSIPFALSYSGISYLLLLILATGFSIRNAIQSEQGARPFWALLATGYGLWALHQSLTLYYQLGLHIDTPDSSIADDILFLHVALLIAAVATPPNLRFPDVKQNRWILNTLLILGLWAFMYGFIVAPYKYASSSPDTYGTRFDHLYLVENLVLIAMLVVALQGRPPWKMIYLHLLGASSLYTLSSTAANIAIDSGGYLNGKLYGLGLTASVCWFVWVPLSPRFVPKTDADTSRFRDRQNSHVSKWAMLSVVLISIPMIWELFQRNENESIRTVRLMVATAAIVLLAGGAYLREYIDRRELASSFNRRLIQAQEEERARIARELHDNVAHRVVLLAFQLAQLKKSQHELSDDMLNQFSKMQDETAALSTSIHHLSRELHSPTLELLGLSAAIRGWCNEFGENRKVDIVFESHDEPLQLPPETSLHLYRVLQEALNNAAKHSGTKRFEVQLRGTLAEVHLRVTDLGRGFDVRTAIMGSGMGLRSMQERVRLMNGHLEIESQPNHGTTIHVRVPIDPGGQPLPEFSAKTA